MQGRFWYISEQASGQEQGPTAGSRRGVDKTSTFINHSKFFAQMTKLASANFLHSSCEFVLQLTGVLFPLAPLHTGCGLSDLYTQFLSSWAMNGKRYRHHTRCWPGVSSLYHIFLPYAGSASTGFLPDLWCFTGQQCGHSSVPAPGHTGTAGSFLMGRCCASNTAPLTPLPSLLTIPSHSCISTVPARGVEFKTSEIIFF